jgi:hypothetical protein
MPKIGSTIRIALPCGITRYARVLGYDDDMVLVRWIDYALPNEWVPVRHLDQ